MASNNFENKINSDGKSLEDNAIEELRNADIKQMLTFVLDMIAAYPTDTLKEMKETLAVSSDIVSNEEILLVIDEVLRLRGEL